MVVLRLANGGHQPRRGEMAAPSAACSVRPPFSPCNNLGWRNIRIQAEQIRWVVHRLRLSKTCVVLAEGRPDDLRAIIGGEVVDIRLAEQVWLASGPERPHPRDVLVGRGGVCPLTDRVEVPL